MGKGKGKGSSFERLICKQLSQWISDGDRDDIFWRTAGSGAMAKTRSKSKKGTFGQYGDVQATDPIGQWFIDLFTIEIKRGYTRSTFFDLFDKLDKAGQQEWDKFLCQVLQDKKNAKSKYWMLICKRDRREAMMVIPYNVAKKLPGMGHVPHMRGIVQLKDGREIKYYLTKFEELFEIDPSCFASLK